MKFSTRFLNITLHIKFKRSERRRLVPVSTTLNEPEWFQIAQLAKRKGVKAELRGKAIDKRKGCVPDAGYDR